MPSLGDSAVIIFLGLLLFGPKGLAQIARQLGKLMGEFRRASNEFRMQMEEELRVSEQADRQKQIAAIEAAAPTPPLITSSAEEDGMHHPHLHAAPADTPLQVGADPIDPKSAVPETIGEIATPLPIATSGGLSIMPPPTGLPAPRSFPLAPLLDAVPRVEAPKGQVEPEAVVGADERPMRYTNHHDEYIAPADQSVDSAKTPESVHG